MDQDPNTPKYDRVTGLLTDYGKSLGMKEVNKPTSISSDTLQSNPSPLKLPEETTTSNPSFNLTPLESEAERIAKIKTTQESDISSLLKEMGGIEAKESKYQEDLGATQAKQDYDRYSADIEQEKRNIEKFERDILRNNPTGALRGGQADLLRNAQRESLQKQADLAILGNASLGKYNTALEIAKNKVEMELKPLQAELDAKKFIYEQNKDLFSTAQLSKLNSLIKADEAKIEEEKANKLKANEMIINAMQGKAPQSLISKAKDMLTQGKTPTEIAGILGDYSLSEGDRLNIKAQKAQIANIYSQIEERRNPTLSPAEQIKQNEILAQEKTKIDTFSNVAILANKLLNNPKLPRAVGLSTYTVTPGSQAYDFKQTANQLINTLAAANLDKMKGAMSDKDIQFLRNIESNLALGMSEQGFKDELSRIMTSVTGKLKEDYGVDFKINMSDLSNDELMNLPSQNEDNASFFNNL